MKTSLFSQIPVKKLNLRLKRIIFPLIVLFLHFDCKLKSQRNFTFFMHNLLHDSSPIKPISCLCGYSFSEPRSKTKGIKMNVLASLHCSVLCIDLFSVWVINTVPSYLNVFNLKAIKYIYMSESEVAEKLDG